MTAQLVFDFATVDVFTQTKFEGNPLAIVKVPLSSALTQDQKQTIAKEFNYSETVFLHERQEDHGYEWTVDIFTTEHELPFAGHPTIGTACHVLSEVAKSESNVCEDAIHAKFNVKAGKIDLHYVISEKVAKAAIPHDIHIHKKKYNRESLLSIQPNLNKAGRSGVSGLKAESEVVSIVKGMTFVLIELEDEDALRAVSTTSGVIVTELDAGWNQSPAGAYFYVRFADSEDGTRNLRTRMIEGLLEDPATGSAASALVGYLSLKEGKPNQTLKFAITQGVEMGRRSNIGVEVGMTEACGVDSVNLVGSAVQVMEGRLVV